jgi:hypothetical protein
MPRLSDHEMSHWVASSQPNMFGMSSRDRATRPGNAGLIAGGESGFPGGPAYGDVERRIG